MLPSLLYSKSSSDSLDVLLGKSAFSKILQKCIVFIVTTRALLLALTFTKVPLIYITIQGVGSNVGVSLFNFFGLIITPTSREIFFA